MKKRFLVLMMALVAVCLFALTPQKAEAATIVDSGTCGTNLTWTLDNEGTLTISGDGAMDVSWGLNYDWVPPPAPWYGYRNIIERVIIAKGVTTIASFAFVDCNSLTSIKIPDSVTDIASSAVLDCSSLTGLWVDS